jgi:hypothetical protein
VRSARTIRVIRTVEADKIMERLPHVPHAQSVNDIRRIAHEVMGDYYGRTMGGEERYTEIAEEIWRGCQRVQ